MATKTSLSEQEQGLNEADAQEFFRRLDEFKETLNDKEKLLLASMVVAAAEDGAQGEAPQEQDLDESKLPDEQEGEAFADKLNQFHDNLPDNLHLYLDSLIGKTFLKDEAEVQGYHWLFAGWVPMTQVSAYKAYCYEQGGDYWRVFPARPVRYQGKWWRKVGCWEADY
jgi:hypothetical protein